MSPRTREQSEQLRRERRQQILRAAAQVFAEQGYHQTTVTTIAERAGLGRGTVYWYFESKEAIFQALVNGLLDEMMAGVMGAVDPSQPVLTQLRQIVQATLETYRARPQAVRLTIGLWGQADSALLERLNVDFNAWYARVAAQFTSLVQAGMDNGEISPGDAQAVASAFCALLDGWAMQAVFNPSVLERPEVLVEAALRLFVGPVNP